MRHSWVRFLGSLVVVLGLVGPAQAVDWSSYIDRDAGRTRTAQQQTAPKRAKANKRSTKKVAKAKHKKAKVKARSKSKPRRK